MAEFKQNYFQRKTKPRGPKANNRINSPEVQVISSNGENLGIINTNKAISMAKEEGLDLIEIAPKAIPPVCKIIDIGKFRFKSDDRVINELTILKNKIGTKQVFIEDDSIFGMKRRAIRLLKRIVGFGLDLMDVNGINMIHLVKKSKKILKNHKLDILVKLKQ